jgi:DNA-binding PadR family transcriptional regulator
VAFRKPGTLLPLECRILEVAVRAPSGVYGFALAQELAGDRSDVRLVAHGTLYKALDRMRRAGLLEADWEDPDAAAAEGRPRRRIYVVTAEGRRVLDAAVVESRARLGEAPA